ncbi:TPA: hypothetical protein ACGO2X_000535 [Streptococcus suis]
MVQSIQTILESCISQLSSHFPSKSDGKAYNLLHLNALFDLESELYCDALVQKRRDVDERQALIDMMENSPFRTSPHCGR